MTLPDDPIRAVTHPNPYLLYDALAEGPPIAHVPAIDGLVASTAQAAAQILTTELCGVRPPDEPVPPALRASPAGDLFGRLVRMRDDVRRGPLKDLLAAALQSVDLAQVDEIATAEAQSLRARGASLDRVVRELAARTLARLLGVTEGTLDTVVVWVDALAVAFRSGADEATIARARAAAEPLTRAISAAERAPGLMRTLMSSAEACAISPDDVRANAVGLLTQSHESTAGLLGNALVMLARSPAARDALRQDTTHLPAFVDRVLRDDPPVQNTRRFVLRDGEVAGTPLRRGDMVLVLLAAADAGGQRPLAFGAGKHACPGAALARTIAVAGLRSLLAAGLDPARACARPAYLPSGNTRMPTFVANGGVRS